MDQRFSSRGKKEFLYLQFHQRLEIKFPSFYFKFLPYQSFLSPSLLCFITKLSLITPGQK